MKAKHIHTNNNSRFYKLSEPVKTGIRFFGRFDIVREMKSWVVNEILPEYQQGIGEQFPEEGISLIAVSDLKNGTERLVFPAFTFEGNYCTQYTNIDGRPVVFSMCADTRHVKPDEVYMRHLCMINGLKWEGFESEE